LCRVAAHSDWCFFCAVYKYSYLLTYLLTWTSILGVGLAIIPSANGLISIKGFSHMPHNSSPILKIRIRHYVDDDMTVNVVLRSACVRSNCD